MNYATSKQSNKNSPADLLHSVVLHNQKNLTFMMLTFFSQLVLKISNMMLILRNLYSIIQSKKHCINKFSPKNLHREPMRLFQPKWNRTHVIILFTPCKDINYDSLVNLQSLRLVTILVSIK